jgi:hypothetical protein
MIIVLRGFSGLCLWCQNLQYGYYYVPSVSLSYSTQHDHKGYRVVRVSLPSSSQMNQHEIRGQGSSKTVNQRLWKTVSFRRNLSSNQRRNQEWLFCIASNRIYVVMRACICYIKCTIKYNKILVQYFDEMLHVLLGMQVLLRGARKKRLRWFWKSTQLA